MPSGTSKFGVDENSILHRRYAQRRSIPPHRRSPDLHHQLYRAGLHPEGRRSVIEAALLTHGHGDHYIGIFELSTRAIF